MRRVAGEAEAGGTEPEAGETTKAGDTHVVQTTAASAATETKADIPAVGVGSTQGKHDAHTATGANTRVRSTPTVTGAGAEAGSASRPWQRCPLKARSPPAWLVQQYLARPMTLAGRKFDIRAFALVTHDRAVHFCRDWIVRTCSEPFDMSDLSNRTVGGGKGGGG